MKVPVVNLLLVCAFCAWGLPGCRSLPYDESVPLAFTLEVEEAPRRLVDPDGTNVVPVSVVIAQALLTDPALYELAVRSRRAAGDLAAMHPESPEVRFGYEESRDSRRGWSSQEAWSRGVEVGERRSSGDEVSTSQSRQTSRRQTPFPIDPVQVSEREGTGRDVSRSRGVESTRSQTTSTEQRTQWDYLSGEEDALSVALRIRPPNPWQQRAERQAGRAFQSMAEVELVAEERWLACDILEACFQLMHQRRMLRVQRVFVRRASALAARIEEAQLAGSLTSDVLADVRRLSGNALAAQYRLETRVKELERDLRRLTGMAPDRMDLESLRGASIFPFVIPEAPEGDSALALTLGAEHVRILGARWSLRRSEAEWGRARAGNVPWISHLEGGYAWWDGERTGSSTSESRGEQRQTTRSQQVESETENSTGQSREVETPSGDRTERQETQVQETQRTASSVRQERETTTGGSLERSRDNDDGEEWWVEIGVEIPIFEWMAGESRVRRDAVLRQRRAAERIAERVHVEILTALRALRENQAALLVSRRQFQKEIPGLKALAAAAARKGMLGELEALRIDAVSIDLANLLLDNALRAAMGRVELVRVAGVAPWLAPLEVQVPEAPVVPETVEVAPETVEVVPEEAPVVSDAVEAMPEEASVVPEVEAMRSADAELAPMAEALVPVAEDMVSPEAEELPVSVVGEVLPVDAEWEPVDLEAVPGDGEARP